MTDPVAQAQWRDGEEGGLVDPALAGAVDAWMDGERGGDAAAIDRVMGLLASGEPADAALADVTLARVFRARAAAKRGEAMLAEDDAEALDAWILAEQSSRSVPASLRARAQSIEGLGGLLTGGPRLPGADLVERTLARVQSEALGGETRMRIETHRGNGRVRRSVRFADVVSVAALVAVASGVVLPMLGATRERARTALCNGNLGRVAQGFGMYAGSNRDEMPMAMAGLGSLPWWSVDPKREQSNSANLFTLTRERYVPVAQLACPGNPLAPTAETTPGAVDWRRLEEVSYSYQVMFGATKPRWNQDRAMVVLADRSPVILAAVQGVAVSPVANSPNHGYRGQHMLWNDGSVKWSGSPVCEDGDNIWLPHAVERQLDAIQGKPLPLKGRETPDSRDDVFLGP